MTELRLEDLEFPSAGLGDENPLPPLHQLYNESTDMLLGIEKGQQPHDLRVYRARAGALPHRMLDSYDRIRNPRKFKMAVLENKHLKATFLLELGGRLWSLVHKATGRELIYTNPVFQPANLGIRNVWFSGGVEWNCGIFGHSVYTCSPYWVAEVESSRGPVLRLYEFDRLRGVPYQIDAYLPNDSQWLMIRVRIINPHEFGIPMYWWSNIALPEIKDLRILAPTDHVYTHEAGSHELKRAKMHRDGQPDQSYPVNRASDGYFAIPAEHRPWVAGVNGEGVGLVQTSTARLKGRKKFAFSQESGGRRWQNFLSIPGHPYIEVQAGLARSQAEYLTMGPQCEWSFLEAYGLMQLDPKLAHSADYVTAYQAGQKWLDQALNYSWLERELINTEEMSNLRPDRIIQRGSPWGSLERKRREKAHLPPMCASGMVFDDEGITPEAAQWLHLLRKGEMPHRPATETPGTFMTQTEWLGLLEKSVNSGKGNHWLSYLHLGVMHYHHQEYDKARVAWLKSIELEPSAWAYRNLGVLDRDRTDFRKAADWYLKAVALQPEVWQLASETCQTLIDAERPAEVMDLLEKLPPQVAKRGRLQVFRGKAALEMGDLDVVDRILSDVELTDVREGEVNLTELWYWMHQKRISKAEGIPIDQALRERVWRDFPPPERIDFRLWAGQNAPTPEKKAPEKKAPEKKPANCS